MLDVIGAGLSAGRNPEAKSRVIHRREADINVTQLQVSNRVDLATANLDQFTRTSKLRGEAHQLRNADKCFCRPGVSNNNWWWRRCGVARNRCLTKAQSVASHHLNVVSGGDIQR